MSIRRSCLIVAVTVTLALGLLACSVERYCQSPVGESSEPPGGGSAELGITPLTADELWVVARPETGPAPGEEESPASPELRALRPGSDEEIPLPLRHTEVRAAIEAYLASVEVEQQYHNPYAEKIEVVYVFPLPDDAAVSEFLMTIGERTIRGIIREREEAEQIYNEARRMGYVASLLTQERPNVFSQRVANIEPLCDIDIALTYYSTLPFRDGAYLFAFPTVVGPRFNPPGHGDGIAAVAQGKPGISGQPTEVQYLAPGQTSAHDLSISVDVEAGVPLAGVESSTHTIAVERRSQSSCRVTLADGAVIPDRDFVLRYRVAGEEVHGTFMVHEDDRTSFTLLLTPPAELAGIGRAPLEHVFVLDCSGSMNGLPLRKAKRAARKVLERLGPEDTFQIIRFSESASALGPHPVPATRRNIERGIDYLERLHGGGGTMMIEGIRAALDFPHRDGAVRLVSFMTDGYIGNEAEILAAIHERLGTSRIFSFGVGSATNRYLLESMARIGRGAVAYLEPDDDAADRAVDTFYERIAHPALADISIDWHGMEVDEVYPSRLPDLWVGRPVVVTGRLNGPIGSRITVHGYLAGERVAYELPLAGVRRDAGPALPQVWARMKIADLAERSLWETGRAALQRDIRDLALRYGLMSRYTAFVAVDSSRITEGDHGVTIAQPVPVPAGVRYETTVQESGQNVRNQP